MKRHTPTATRARRGGHTRLCGMLMGALLPLAALVISPASAGLAQALATATPPAAVPAGTRPDACEPNDSLVAPCALQTETELANYNFVDGTPDVYSFLFKGGRVYSITASSASGIDPAIRVFAAGQAGAPVAENDDAAAGSPDASVQVAAAHDGWYIVEVTNRAPGDMRGKTYALAARSSAAPAGTAAPAQAAPGDMLENNYDTSRAARVAWGVPYDLSLECPDPRPGACYAGDHDFLLLPVKRGVPLIALTYDLGPGADTVLTLYKPDSAQPGAAGGGIAGWSAVAGNDDIAPGRTLRSQVLLTPNWDGDALLVVAQSERRNPPAVPAALGPAGRYRLMLGSPAMDALQAVLSAQSDLAPAATPAPAITAPGAASSSSSAPRATSVPPAPTPAPQSVDAPAPGSAKADAEEIIKEACTSGLATVERDLSEFYSAANPASERRLLATYPKGARVALLGSCYIGWVKVQPEHSVTPGWMFAPDLKLAEQAAASAPEAAVPNSSLKPAAGDASGPAPARQTASVQVVKLPAPPAPAPPAVRRQTLSITLRVVDRQGRALSGIKLLLVDTFGRQLVDAVTPADGQVVFTPDLAPNTAVSIQLPAAGISVPIDPASPAVTITLPRGNS